MNEFVEITVKNTGSKHSLNLAHVKAITAYGEGTQISFSDGQSVVVNENYTTVKLLITQAK